MALSINHLRVCAKAQVEAQLKQIENGTDPDEHTIYNVLCPKLRSKWSRKEEYDRRVTKTQPIDYSLQERYHSPDVVYTIPTE